MKEQTHILGIRFDNMSREELSENIKEMLSSDKTSYIVTPNPEIVECAQQDDGYKKILNCADLSIADGVGVELASHLLCETALKRIPGIEIGEMIMSICAESGDGVFFLGGKQGVAKLAAENMQKKYEGLVVSGTHHGYFPQKCNNLIRKRINQSGAKVLFVCMGFPYQEKWIYENRDRLHSVRVVIALGGSLDVYSGNVKRAPRFLCDAGLEWAWRAVCSPLHFKRVMKLPLFVRHVAEEKLIRSQKKSSNK